MKTKLLHCGGCGTTDQVNLIVAVLKFERLFQTESMFHTKHLDISLYWEES